MYLCMYESFRLLSNMIHFSSLWYFAFLDLHEGSSHIHGVLEQRREDNRGFGQKWLATQWRYREV